MQQSELGRASTAYWLQVGNEPARGRGAAGDRLAIGPITAMHAAGEQSRRWRGGHRLHRRSNRVVGRAALRHATERPSGTTWRHGCQEGSGTTIHSAGRVLITTGPCRRRRGHSVPIHSAAHRLRHDENPRAESGTGGDSFCRHARQDPAGGACAPHFTVCGWKVRRP